MFDIIEQSENYVICIKPFGISSEHDMPKLLTEALGGEIFCVHRLDNAVGGIMVFAKNRKTAALLSKQISDHTFEKKYLAVIEGKPSENSGEMRDLLFKDSFKNKSYVVKRMRKGVKEAVLNYNLLSEQNGLSLVEISLVTGRTHQIRVQFASRKMPLVGDRRYGSKIPSDNICLWSHSLSFYDNNGEKVCFTSPPPHCLYFDKF